MENEVCPWKLYLDLKSNVKLFFISVACVLVCILLERMAFFFHLAVIIQCRNGTLKPLDYNDSFLIFNSIISHARLGFMA